MRKTLSVALLLLLAWPAPAQVVKLPAEVKAEPGLVMVAAETDCSELTWWAPDGGLQLIPANLLRDSRTAIGFALTPGRYRLQAIGAKSDRAVYAVTTVIVGTVPPPPPPPPPPGQKVAVPSVIGQGGVTASAALEAVGLVPKVVGTLTDTVTAQQPAAGVLVDRGSTVTLTTAAPEPPAPIPAAGLRVLITENVAARSGLPAGQREIIDGSQAFRDFLDRVCVTTPTGKGHDWYIWPYDADTSRVSQLWQDAMKRVPKDKGKQPWLIISNGKTGYEGPLPAGVDEVTKLINKYADK